MPPRALPDSIPRAGLVDGFIADPLNFLTQARNTHGDLFALRDRGAIFSRADDSTGVVAAFGIDNQRTVLSDLESFGMPVSAAHQLKLPAKLINLNRGLHSMTGVQHATHRRALAALLSDGVEHYHRAMHRSVDSFSTRWTVGSTIRLLGEMRELALWMCRHLLFGGPDEERAGLAERMRTYFELRREASSPSNPAGSVPVIEVRRLGDAVDADLRSYLRACRTTASPPGGILARLARLDTTSGNIFTEDEVVGHANVLFVSSTEPVAVSLTWILLILSQLPTLRRALREELAGAAIDSASPRPSDLPLLDSVINETLRILPPNAFMVRTTTRPVVLGGFELPQQCEIVLCPFVSHRDHEYFPQPNDFKPDRWSRTVPSPFVYFPFGAGGHACVGRALALSTIRAALTCLLARYDLVLAGDQEIDWRLHIIFMPRVDPLFAIHSPSSSSPVASGTLGGPVAAMIRLDN